MGFVLIVFADFSSENTHFSLAKKLKVVAFLYKIIMNPYFFIQKHYETLLFCLKVLQIFTFLYEKSHKNH